MDMLAVSPCFSCHPPDIAVLLFTRALFMYHYFVLVCVLVVLV